MNSRKINHFPDHLEVNLASKPTSPLKFPGPLTPPPHPSGISNSLRGGGLDIFWNYTLLHFAVILESFYQ